MNPFTIVLITGMAGCFLICAGLLYIVLICVVHFINRDENS